MNAMNDDHEHKNGDHSEDHDHDHDHNHDHDHDHDHNHETDHDHENALVSDSQRAAKDSEEKVYVFKGTEAERAAAAKMLQSVEMITDSLKLAAERGWKVRLTMKSGQLLERMFITGTDWYKGYVALERVGERHLAPTLIHIPDIAAATAIWN
jgi:hypothetical protein